MTKTVFPSIIVTLIFLCSTATFAAEQKAPLKVACIGDSITFGFGIKKRTVNSFPAQLGTMLGKGYEVQNFGVSAATLLKKGNKPYWNLPQFKEALNYKPDIVIIKLGTNDTKKNNWKFKEEFKANYSEMVKTFQSLESKPEVWVCYPVPVFPTDKGRWKWGITDEVVKEGVIPFVDDVAKKTGANVINLYKPLAGKSELLPDKVHPNIAGAKVIAETVFAAITANKLKKAE